LHLAAVTVATTGTVLTKVADHAKLSSQSQRSSCGDHDDREDRDVPLAEARRFSAIASMGERFVGLLRRF
jgi:hypothetical protein